MHSTTLSGSQQVKPSWNHCLCH